MNRYLRLLDRTDFRSAVWITVLGGSALGNATAWWLHDPATWVLRVPDVLLFVIGVAAGFIAPFGIMGRSLYLRRRASQYPARPR